MHGVQEVGANNYMFFMSLDNVHMYTSAINCLSVCLSANWNDIDVIIYYNCNQYDNHKIDVAPVA